MEDWERDRKDKRCLEGKYTPEAGVCRVCTGKVIAEIAFHHDGRIGGPPAPGYISKWYCEECQLVYRKRPPDKP